MTKLFLVTIRSVVLSEGCSRISIVLRRAMYTGEAMVTGDSIEYYLTDHSEAGITSIRDPYIDICAIMFHIDTGQALVTSNCVRNHNSTQHLH